MITHLNHAEAIFFAAAVAVFIASFLSLREALTDQIISNNSEASDPRRIIAGANVRQEWVRMAMALVMIMASTLALFLEPPPPNYKEVPQSAVYTVAWIVIAIIMLLCSALEWKARKLLIKQYHRRAGDIPHRREDEQTSEDKTRNTAVDAMIADLKDAGEVRNTKIDAMLADHKDDREKARDDRNEAQLKDQSTAAAVVENTTVVSETLKRIEVNTEATAENTRKDQA